MNNNEDKNKKLHFEVELTEDFKTALLAEANLRMMQCIETLRKFDGDLCRFAMINICSAIDILLAENVSKSDVMQAVSDAVNMRCSFDQNKLTAELGEKYAQWIMNYKIKKP